MQEGQLDLERMFRRVRGIGLDNHLGDDGQRMPVHGHATKRRLERIDRRRGDAAQRNEVGRPDQHHALDRLRDLAKRRERLGRHGPRIDVARVRCNERLGQNAAGRFDRAEQFRNLRL